MTRDEVLSALATILDRYVANPTLPIPFEIRTYSEEEHVTVVFNVGSREKVTEVLRAFGGKWEKEASASLMYFTQRLTPTIRLKMYTGQETVCTRKVVGYETIPAREAYQREIVEWECGSVLGEGEV